MLLNTILEKQLERLRNEIHQVEGGARSYGHQYTALAVIMIAKVLYTILTIGIRKLYGIGFDEEI